jgi:hypothetical protein
MQPFPIQNLSLVSGVAAASAWAGIALSARRACAPLPAAWRRGAARLLAAALLAATSLLVSQLAAAQAAGAGALHRIGVCAVSCS